MANHIYRYAEFPEFPAEWPQHSFWVLRLMRWWNWWRRDRAAYYAAMLADDANAWYWNKDYTKRIYPLLPPFMSTFRPSNRGFGTKK